MNLRRLSWAGIEASDGALRLLVDPLEDTTPLQGFLGKPRNRLVQVAVGDQAWGLVTHLHWDHCDPGLLKRLQAGRTFCHSPVLAALRERGVDAVPADLWQTVRIGSFRVIPVPSQDWRGDDQVAWVIEDGRQRIIHCGDTIWHGHWYEIARRHGPFDFAFLPINGVTVQLDGFTPTEVPATLTPEQAIEAATVIQARTACAIHHGLFDNPPRYKEQPDVVARFIAAGRRRGIHAIAPGDGEEVG